MTKKTMALAMALAAARHNQVIIDTCGRTNPETFKYEVELETDGTAEILPGGDPIPVRMTKVTVIAHRQELVDQLERELSAAEREGVKIVVMDSLSALGRMAEEAFADRLTDRLISRRIHPDELRPVDVPMRQHEERRPSKFIEDNRPGWQTPYGPKKRSAKR